MRRIPTWGFGRETKRSTSTPGVGHLSERAAAEPPDASTPSTESKPIPHVGMPEPIPHVGLPTPIPHVGMRVMPRSKYADAAARAMARIALKQLGWKAAVAHAAVDTALDELGENVALDALIRRALQRCTS